MSTKINLIDVTKWFSIQSNRLQLGLILKCINGQATKCFLTWKLLTLTPLGKSVRDFVLPARKGYKNVTNKHKQMTKQTN